MVDLEKEIERLQAEFENADFQNRVLKKECDQYKDDLSNGDENLFKARQEQKRLEERNNDLERESLEQTQKIAEQAESISA